MANSESSFRGPMQPWPDLADTARTIHLPEINLRLFSYQLGDHPTHGLIFVHGLGDEADSWRHILRPLAEHTRVIAIDLPGFGRSAKPDIAYTIPFYVRVLNELIQVLQLQQVTLVGNSMGAAICQAAAFEHPDWLANLVLVDGSLLTAGQRLSLSLLLFLVPGLGEWLYTRYRKDPQAAYESLRLYYHDLDNLPEADCRFLYQRVNERVWDDAQRRAYFSALRSMAAYTSGQQKGLAEQLRHFNIPTLLVWGEQDQVIPLASGQALAKAQPSAHLEVLANAGHLPHQERPQHFCDLLAQFFVLRTLAN
jgi:pimeloyl-ACP methyl ester carboxylesterase